MDRERALQLIYDTFDEVNRQLPAARRLDRNPATVIVGAGGVLDSLGVVTFVLAIEEKSADALGHSVQLLKPEWLTIDDGPLHTVERLAAHLTTLGPS
jgi:D-alanine--poly(phosphoribitol) ligase subunit 2